MMEGILAGQKHSIARGDKTFAWLSKIDNNGNQQWEKLYGWGYAPAGSCRGYDYCAYSVQQTKDKGYILAGYREEYIDHDDSDRDVFLVKTNSKGDVILGRSKCLSTPLFLPTLFEKILELLLFRGL